MAGDTAVTVVGNLTANPELRFTPAGVAVVNFTVASTSRVFDRTANEWRDGSALFMRCTAWREAAENIAETLSRGARAIVTGRLKQRSYETREGEKRTVVELDVEEAGPSLRYATAKVNKTSRNSTAVSNELVGATQRTAAGASDDPWATGGSSGFGDDPGF